MPEMSTISEVSYLTTANTPQYRRIMRIFYEENERMHYRLYREEVLELLRRYPGYEGYPEDQLKADLDALTAWKNLSALQDPRRVFTIEDYKNKQFRYSITDRAVEIERLTIRLEELVTESGSLSSSYIIRIEQSLAHASALASSGSPREVYEWWHALQEDFRRLDQNYKDYLREFYSGESDRILRSVEFILHKDRFITYLEEFVRELQVQSLRIEAVLRSVSVKQEKILFERIVQGELEVPRARQQSADEIRQRVEGQYASLRSWFIAPEGGISECARILDITDEIIRKIIQNAALIIALQNWGVSRRDDYRRYIDMFASCETLDDAHRLSAHLFGVQQIRHYKVNDARSTDSIHSSPYEEEAFNFVLKPRTRSYKPRIDKTGFESRDLEKFAARTAYLSQAQDDQAMAARYTRNGMLDIGRIDEVVTAQTRQTLLRWISTANSTASRKGRTEYGAVFRLKRRKGSIVLHCEDGDLTMPDYVLMFVDKEE